MLYISMEKQEYDLMKKKIAALHKTYFFMAPAKLLMKEFNETDQIIIYSLSNLGNTLPKINKALSHLLANGPALKILSMNLDFNASSIPYLLHTVRELAAIEDQKKQILLMKQKKGIQKARASGKTIGRPQIPYPENWKELYEAWIHHTLKLQDILSQTNLKKSTFYLLVQRYEHSFRF